MSWNGGRNHLAVDDISSPMITVNIGGTTFTTRLSTLKQSGYFTRYFELNGEYNYKFNNGVVFVDHDPTNFPFVLNYLRGSLECEDVKNDSKFVDSLCKEAKFFDIPKLKEYLLSIQETRRNERNAEYEAKKTSGNKFLIFAIINCLILTIIPTIVLVLGDRECTYATNPQEAEKELIDLNVGGTFFTTKLSTLLESEYFKNLIPGKPKAKNETKFIDRDPKLFSYILSFLRGNFKTVPNSNERARILREANYFEIRSLQQYLRNQTVVKETTTHDEIIEMPMMQKEFPGQFTTKQWADFLSSDNFLIPLNINGDFHYVPRRLLKEAHLNGFHELFSACGNDYKISINSVEKFEINCLTDDIARNWLQHLKLV